MYILPILIDQKGNLNFIVSKGKQVYKNGELQCKGKIKIDNLFITFDKCDGYVDPMIVSYRTDLPVIRRVLKKIMYILDFLNQNNRIRYEVDQKRRGNSGLSVEDVTDKYNKGYAEVKEDKRSGIQYIVVSEGARLYKGMMKTDMNTNEIDNIPAGRIGWFTSYREIAEDYIRSSKNNVVNEYRAIRPLKLFLLSKHNIELLVNKLIKEMIKDMKNGRKYIDKINVIKAVTGYQCTFKEQLDLLKRMHGFVEGKIRRKREWKHTYGKRYKVKSDLYSELKEDLNRVSIATVIDKKMAKIICKMYNLDGYYNWNVPSLWEYGEFEQKSEYPKMNEEIGLCVQRGAVKRV